MRHWIAIVLFVSALGAQTLEAPPWLAPFPGAREEVSGVTKTARATRYTVTAPVAEVKAHYEALATRSKVEARSTFDGIGEVVRLSAPGRTAVVRIQSADAGTSVETHLIAAEVVATPMRPGVQPAASAATRGVIVPRFAWPAWLVAPTGTQFSKPPSPVPEAEMRYGLGRDFYPCLSAAFNTSGKVDDAFRFYEQLMRAQGKPVIRARLDPTQAVFGGKYQGSLRGVIEFEDRGGPVPLRGEINIGWTGEGTPKLGSVWVCQSK